MPESTMPEMAEIAVAEMARFITDAKVGTMLVKAFQRNPEAFDVFIRTKAGWVCVDQEGVQINTVPIATGSYFEYKFTASKV